MIVTTPHSRFALLLMAAIIVDYIPVINVPLLWSETFFHEISHGLMAILTGGNIVSITLNFDGSGYCVTQGGVPLLISFAGYSGSAAWGFLIYLLADNIKPGSAHIFMGFFIALLLISLILWAENISTYIIMALMIGLFSAFIKYTDSKRLTLILQFIGIFVLFDAIRSPLALIDGRNHGDGAKLSDLTYVPEIIWVGIWTGLGLAMLFIMYQMSHKYAREPLIKS